MALLDTIATRLGYSKAPPKTPPPEPLLQATGAGQAWSIPDLSLADAQEELFQRLSWIYGAIMAVATVAASAQLNVLKLSGEKRKDIPNHELEMRLMRPNPLDSRTEIMVKTAAYYDLTGNAYWWLNRRNENAPPAEIWCLPTHQIEPIPDGRMFLKGYKYLPGLGEPERILQPWEIIHFKRFHPRNWFVGLSPIESLATVAMGDLKAQQYNTEFFGKNNAKVPGALVFADDVSDPAWDKLKRDVKDGWGGTQRSGAMMLRGAGKGGVQWVQMALSQTDMEFLGSRTFTKEEIYSIFAPGLASVLAVNATEANARSGKATFIEMAVWPMLVAIAEKVTNNLLPAYGPDLVAEFDDLRVTDRLLELQEQTAFGTVHTVDEIRERYYEDKPLGDERGVLLPAQIGPATPGPVDEEAAPHAQPAEALAPMGTLGDMPPSIPPQEQGTTAPEGTGSGAAESPALAALDTEAVPAEGLAQKELAAWRRFAVRHGVAKAQEFGCEHVPQDVAERIRTGLSTATTIDEIKAVFAAKQPAPPPRDKPDRDRSERAMQSGIGVFLTGQQGRVLEELHRARRL